MATTPGRTRCKKCGKEKVTSKCSGCFEDFCYTHLGEHRQELSKQLDEIEVHRDQFQQKIAEQAANNTQKHALIQQINQWESESIERIKKTAEETRQLIEKLTSESTNRVEQNLNQLAAEVKHCREEDDIMETDLQKWKEELQQMAQQLNKPSNIEVRLGATPLINRIQVESLATILTPMINISAKWIQNGSTVAGGNGEGLGLNQLASPWGVCVDDDQNIYVADASNHRIMKWRRGATSGVVVAGGRGAGNRNDQLNYPVSVIVDKQNDSLIICDYNNQRVVRWPRRNGTTGETIISNVVCCDIAIDNNQHLYVSDVKNHEVRRWKIGEANGILVAGGNGRGNRLDQLDQPYHIFIDQDHSVYVSEYGNHRVVKWKKGAKEGTVVAAGQMLGDRLMHLSGPRGIIVDQQGTLYIADQNNHRVIRWLKGASEGTMVVGGDKPGGQAGQLNQPFAISFDRKNNLYVVDYLNHRVQKFTVDLN